VKRDALSVDVAEFMKQHDLLYERAPRRWLDGLPLGNGQLGAVVWGDGGPLRFSLGKTDTWERRTPDPTHPQYNYASLRELYEQGEWDTLREVFQDRLSGEGEVSPTRLPMPRLELHFGRPAERYTARVQLHEAVARGTMRWGDGQVRWQACVLATRNVLLVRLRSEGDVPRPAVHVRTDHFDDDTQATLKRWGYPPPETDEKDGREWLVQRYPDGGCYVVMWERAAKRSGKSERLLLTITTSAESDDPLRAAGKNLDRAGKTRVRELRAEHDGWWGDYWSRSFVSIPEAKMEGLYYVELYKLGCNARKEGEPVTLQGVWGADGKMPPWHGDYHMDVNVQQTYWPIYATNRLELGKPLYNRFGKNLERFKRMGEAFFGREGAWSRCEMGLGGEPIYGFWSTNFWPGNGAWLAHHFWLHYRYTMSRKFLRKRAYPFMRAFMQTYLHLLEVGEDGCLHLPVSHSPEWEGNRTGSLGPDTTCDLELVRWLAGALLETVTVLEIDDPDAPRWREVLRTLAPRPADETGLWVHREQPYDMSHRHHSHLMGIHPLETLIANEQPEAVELVRRTFARFGAWRVHGMGGWSGWSYPWAAQIVARVGQGRLAREFLRQYFRTIGPNSFHLNGEPDVVDANQWSNSDEMPMTLEAGFGFAAAVAEMLLQSWGGKIRVFTGVPETWGEVYFERLRAEGAFLVSARRARGRTQWVHVASLAGEPLRLVNPFDGPAAWRNPASGKVEELGGDEFMIDLAKGKTCRLIPAEGVGSQADIAPLAPRRPRRERHWFGLQHVPRF